MLTLSKRSKYQKHMYHDPQIVWWQLSVIRYRVIERYNIKVIAIYNTIFQIKMRSCLLSLCIWWMSYRA